MASHALERRNAAPVQSTKARPGPPSFPCTFHPRVSRIHTAIYLTGVAILSDPPPPNKHQIRRTTNFFATTRHSRATTRRDHHFLDARLADESIAPDPLADA